MRNDGASVVKLQDSPSMFLDECVTCPKCGTKTFHVGDVLTFGRYFSHMLCLATKEPQSLEDSALWC